MEFDSVGCMPIAIQVAMTTENRACVVCVRIQGGVEVQGCDVYVGRGCTMGGHNRKPSVLGNPFKVGMPDIDTVEDAIMAYWYHLHDPKQTHLLEYARTLKGLVLGCHCKKKGHEPCHGDVVLYIGNGILTPVLERILRERGVNLNASEKKEPIQTKAEPLQMTEQKVEQPRRGASVPASQPKPSPIKKPPRGQLGRVRAGFVCLGLGDSLGVPFEFTNMGKFTYTGKLEHRFTLRGRHGVWHNGVKYTSVTLGVGQVSDDSELALTLARRLIADKGYDAKKVALDYIKWSHTTPIRGSNTSKLFHVDLKTKYDPTGWEHYLKAYTKIFGFPPTTPPFTVTTDAAEGSQSNGSLMRCFPLACLWQTAPVDADVWASNPSTVTREVETIYISCLRLALTGSSAREIWAYAKAAPTKESVKQVFTDILQGAQRPLADVGKGKDRKKEKGWAVHAFYAAMACLSALASETPPSFSELMKWVIAGHPGSDTDTNGAIAGALIGSIIGWDELVKDPTTVSNIQIMVAAGKTDTDIPRPPEYRMEDIEDVCQQLTALSALH